MENELGVKPIKGLLWKLAVPAITAQIVNVLYKEGKEILEEKEAVA